MTVAAPLIIRAAYLLTLLKDPAVSKTRGTIEEG